MASMRDIKRRKGSIQSTQQITKAMKLVSTVKLQRAKTQAEKTKNYFDCMYQTVNSMMQKAGTINHPFLQGKEGKKAVVMITSNRGLAGGYNSNVVKLVTRGAFTPKDTVIYAIGRKGKDALARAGYEIALEEAEVMEAPTYADAMAISRQLLTAFKSGEIGEIYLAYTRFKNTVVQEPVLMKLLPMETNHGEHLAEDSDAKKDAMGTMNFEMDEEDALELIIPKYVTSLIYGALMEAVASENGARMQAMDNATSNADEMISSLSLQYNRARQGAITQELTEIIAGANAIS